MKKIIASGAAAFLVFGAVAFSAPAFADDTVPVDEAAITQVVEETPVEEAPVVESAPVEVVQEGVVETAPESIQQVAAFVPYAASARWLIPATWDYNTTPSYQSAIFPQLHLLTEGVPCGQWSQDDAYWIENAQEEALFLSLDDDGYLTMGEDSAIYASHVFTKGPVCEVPEEEPPVLNECVTGQSTHSTNLNNLWGNVDTRSAGHYEYVEGGLHVWTDDNSSQAKVSLGQAISFPLHDTGVLGIDWTGSTPPPGLNLFVNFGADGNGTLVYESVYGQDLWLTNGSSATVKANAPVNGGGNGSQWHGTINQWLEAYPDATVTGIAFSLGSGVLGDGVISSITVGCGTHTFDYEEEVVIEEPPVEEPPVVVPPVVEPPVVEEPIVPAAVVVTPVTATDLAETGGPNMLPWDIGGGALLLAGLSAILFRRRFAQQ